MGPLYVQKDPLFSLSPQTFEGRKQSEQTTECNKGDIDTLPMVSSPDTGQAQMFSATIIVLSFASSKCRRAFLQTVTFTFWPAISLC